MKKKQKMDEFNLWIKTIWKKKLYDVTRTSNYKPIIHPFDKNHFSPS